MKDKYRSYTKAYIQQLERRFRKKKDLERELQVDIREAIALNGLLNCTFKRQTRNTDYK